MTYKELYESAIDKLEKSKITLGEFEKMIAPLNAEIATADSDTISRRTVISAICSACGKIDCDKMDKCEKLQLPPANNSEIPNSSDTISRQAAIDALRNMQTYKLFSGDDMLLIDQAGAQTELMMLPPAQPEQLEQCPIYGGMCAYPSDQCYDCPRHAGAKMGVTS